tara:strand:- start:51 stop:287 length:237 start_codon:yes stop_codon:yes gene_type:complete
LKKNIKFKISNKPKKIRKLKMRLSSSLKISLFSLLNNNKRKKHTRISLLRIDRLNNELGSNKLIIVNNRGKNNKRSII